MTHKPSVLTPGHRKRVKRSWSPESLQQFIECFEQDASILRALVRARERTAFEVALDLPGYAGWHGALLWIAAEQVNHALARHANIQSWLRFFSGEDLSGIPVTVGRTDSVDPRMCAGGIKYRIRPVNQHHAMLLRMNENVRREHAAVDDFICVGEIQRNQQASPDPGHVLRVNAIWIDILHFF